jgi:hypothetical protein
MRTTPFIAGLLASGLFAAPGQELQNASLPEIKAAIRFHSDSYGNVPDEIQLPASTLLPSKNRRVIEGDLGRLPIRIYIRETPSQTTPAIEVNLVNNRTNQAVAGYPTRQVVGPLGMLSFNIPLLPTELETLVRTAKKSVEGKLDCMNQNDRKTETGWPDSFKRSISRYSRRRKKRLVAASLPKTNRV